MALSLAAAALASAVVGAGATAYSASQANKANNRALAAQNAASQQQLQAQQENFNRIYDLNQPFVAGGQGAYSRLLSQFGIAPAATGSSGVPGGSAGAPADPRAAFRSDGGAAQAGAGGPAYPGAPYTAGATPAGGGGFDAATYLAQNPDVAANYQQMLSTPEGKAYLESQGVTTPEQAAALHYQQFGKTEGRAEPMNPTTPANPGTVVTPDLMNGTRPEAAAPPSFGPRTDVKMQDYGSAPSLASFFSDFQADPGYQYRQSEALNGVNAASAVRGKLRSGDAAKALATLSSNLASQEYGNWFNRQLQQYNAARGAFENDRSFSGNLWNQQQGRADTNYNNDRAYGTGLWQYGTDRADTNFNTDRGYQTNRYDTNNANLFNLTDIGLRGAGNISGAGTNYANAASNIYGNQADAASNAAYNRAQANTYAANGIANAAGNLFAAWGGSAGGGGTPGIVAGGSVFGNGVRGIF